MGTWQGLISGGGVMLVLAGAALALGPGRASGQSGAAVISIAPASQNVDTNSDLLGISINVTNVQNLGAFELTLKYNPDVLEFNGVGDFGFLSSTGRTDVCFDNDYAPDAGVARFGCNTVGLVNNGAGKPGPNGDGVLAVMAFKPKAAGDSDLVLVGLDQPYIYTTNGNTQHGQTSLDTVEICNGDDCGSVPIPLTATTGIVHVGAPGVATPTALPPTPTPEPRASRTPDKQATARAVLGTPERTLGDSGSQTTSGGTTTTQPGPDGVLGTTDDVQSAAVLPGPDGVLGTSDDVAAAGVRGLPNTSGGTSGGTVAGAARGPNGAPIAGYGPEAHNNPWPGRAGAGMIMLGALAVLGGVVLQRGARRRA